MQKKYIIKGGYPLKGKIRANGNKNAALPIIAASLLTDEEVIIRNIPNIEDIKIMIDIVKDLGLNVKPEGKNGYRISGLFPRRLSVQSLVKKSGQASCLQFLCSQDAVKPSLPPPGGGM